MVCTSKAQAMGVAIAGAKKMGEPGEQYSMAPTAFNSVHSVTKLADGTAYMVRVRNRFGRPDTCNCPFFLQNAEFGCCKHTVWAGWQADEEERIASLLRE